MINTLPVRYLTIRLILEDSFYPGTDANVKTINCDSTIQSNEIGNATANVTVTQSGGIATPVECECIIYGMNKDDAEALDSMMITSNISLPKCLIEIYAGNDLNGDLPPLYYAGEILTAGIYMTDNEINRPFVIHSIDGCITMNQKSSDTSLNGDIDINTLFRTIIAKGGANYNYNPNPDYVKGIVKLRGALVGNWRDQLKQVCGMFGYSYQILNNDVKITKNVPRQYEYVNRIQEISEFNKMIGFPKMASGWQCAITSVFDSTITFGQFLVIKTTLKQFQGVWQIIGITTRLSTNNSINGNLWYNDYQLIRYNQ